MDVDARTVLTTLKQHGKHRHALRLLACKQNKQTIFSGSAFFHIDAKGTHHILSGLLPVLKRNFWSTTDMARITHGPKKTTTTTKKKKKKGKEKKEQKKSPNTGKGRFFGSIQGSRVHSELADFIMLDDKNFRKKHGTLHPWAKRILAHTVCERKWLPLVCEHPVSDPVRRIGSAIDMICVDPATGNLIFLEFKTGYKQYFENSDGYMSKCLSFMPNSPLNWANIQLTAAVIMLLRQNPSLNLANTSSYVMRIDDEDLCVYHIDNRFIKSMSTCLFENIDMTVLK